MNDSRQFVQGSPLWWEADKVPDQAKKLGEEVKLKMDSGITGSLVFGGPGLTKTSACLWVGYSVAKASFATNPLHVLFVDFQEHMVRVRSAWRKDADTTVEELMERLFKPDILILDDIGRTTGAPEEKEQGSLIVNGRMNRGKKTLATTNSLLNEDAGLKQFLAACDSRVLERFTKLTIDAAKYGKNLRRG